MILNVSVELFRTIFWTFLNAAHTRGLFLDAI